MTRPFRKICHTEILRCLSSSLVSKKTRAFFRSLGEQRLVPNLSDAKAVTVSVRFADKCRCNSPSIRNGGHELCKCTILNSRSISSTGINQSNPRTVDALLEGHRCATSRSKQTSTDLKRQNKHVLIFSTHFRRSKFVSCIRFRAVRSKSVQPENRQSP